MVLTSVKYLVMWRVVVTTEADGPEPSVKVATVASTVVLTETCSPVETVLVSCAQSDHVSETLGVGLAIASTGRAFARPGRLDDSVCSRFLARGSGRVPVSPRFRVLGAR